LIDKTIKVMRQCTGHFGRSTGARAIRETLDSLGSKAMDPFPERGIREVQRVGDGLEALAFDDLAHGLGTTEDPRFLRLLEIGI
jgi:hypothetical protein